MANNSLTWRLFVLAQKAIANLVSNAIFAQQQELYVFPACFCIVISEGGYLSMLQNVKYNADNSDR